MGGGAVGGGSLKEMNSELDQANIVSLYHFPNYTLMSQTNGF